MRVRIGAGKTAGTVAAPPSKSDVHRLLIAAALCAGEQTVIRGFYPSRDIEATVACLCAMGAEISVCGQDCTVRGMPREKKGGEICLPCGESGSTLRFLLPLCMREDGTALLCGSKTLLSRPLAVYESIAKEQGLRFERVGDTALRVGGALCVNGCAADGGISSQFFSGLCFRAAADGGKSEISFTRPLQSAAYLQMTAQVLSRFGVLVKIDAEKITVQGALHSPGECTAQGDWSGAAFFKVLNAFGGDVRVTGLAPDSLQPDRAIQALFQRIQGLGQGGGDGRRHAITSLDSRNVREGSFPAERPPPPFFLPASLIAGAFAFVALSVAAVVPRGNLDVRQCAETVGLMVLAAFHGAMDALILLSHDEIPPCEKVSPVGAQNTFCPDGGLAIA